MIRMSYSDVKYLLKAKNKTNKLSPYRWSGKNKGWIVFLKKKFAKLLQEYICVDWCIFFQFLQIQPEGINLFLVSFVFMKQQQTQLRSFYDYPT